MIRDSRTTNDSARATPSPLRGSHRASLRSTSKPKLGRRAFRQLSCSTNCEHMNPAFRLSDPSDDQLAETIGRLSAPALSGTEDPTTRQRALELMRTTSTVVGVVDDEVVVAVCVELLAPGRARLAALAVAPHHQRLVWAISGGVAAVIDLTAAEPRIERAPQRYCRRSDTVETRRIESPSSLRSDVGPPKRFDPFPINR